MTTRHTTTLERASFTDTLPEDMRNLLSDPEESFLLLRWLRWPDEVRCPHCGATAPGFLATRRIWKCRARGCRRQFSVRVDTLLEDSPIRIGQWLAALWLLSNHTQGVTAHALSAAIDVTPKTAWYLLHRVRVALVCTALQAGPLPAGSTPHERFVRFSRRLLALSRAELDRELEAAREGKPVANPFARRGS